MASTKRDNNFWLSYSDLMTSLFFIMLVLFLVSILKLGYANARLRQTGKDAEEYEEMRIKIKEYERLMQIDKQFEELSKFSALQYIKEKKAFVAKDLIGIEIFDPNDDKIKVKYLETVDNVGQSLQKIIRKLYQDNPELSFQLAIEGTAAIKYRNLVTNNYNPDNKEMYLLSYRRALALYNRWREQGLDFRKYNTEVLICGSGFNGINRDTENEDNNKRFVIQIIPKISRSHD